MYLNFTEPGCSVREPTGFFQRHPTLKFLMRVGFFYIIVIMCSIQLLLAHSGKSQTLDSINVTVELRNENLKKLFKKIESQTGLLFAYQSQQVDSFTDLTLPRATRSVKATLDLAFTGTSLAYRQVNNSVIIFQQGTETNIPDNVKDEYLAAAITGKVTSSDGSPLPGVNVIVKGSTKGTSTDAEGMYTIDANEGDLLVFSFIGYKTFETQVNGRTIIDIALEEDIATLNEVIVNAGYYQVKDRDQTGNISKISAEDIQKQPVSNPLQALTGRMPGVYIQQSSGVPGSSISIQIRGRNSIRQDANNPLYIIDGVPFTSTPLGTLYSGLITSGGSPLSNINPADIESIEVLKDADATAIYGSRGANGVVLITTKKGKVGKTEVDVNLYQGVGQVTRKMDLLNTQEYLTMRRGALANDGATPGSSNPDYDLLNWDTTRYTDWQEKMIGGTAHLTSAQASVSGGIENTRFSFGSGYYRETTVFPGDFSDQKYSTRFSINHTSNNQKFTADFSGSYLVDKNNLQYADITSHALTLPPVAPAAYDSAGNLNWENGNWDYNPFAILKQKYIALTNTLRSDVVIGYEILKGLQLKSNMGYTDLRFEEHTSYPLPSFNPDWGVTEGFATFANNKVQTWIVEPQLNFRRKLGRGVLNALVGFTFQENKSEGEILRATGYGSDELLSNLQSASAIAVISSTNNVYRYNSVFARINYNWNEKYLINLTARRDGSSRFGSGNRFANFGAVGAAWIFSNESFVKDNLGILSFGKFRTSYGTTGSDQIGDYGFLDLWNSSNYTYAGVRGLYPKNVYNPDYQWEINRKFEAGIELGFERDRISLAVSYYRNSSSNQLVGYSLPRITGFTSIQSNLPAEIQNTGVEFEIQSVNIATDDFNWTTALNFTAPRNRLVSYPDIENSSYKNTYEVGKPLTISKVFHYTGVDPETGIYTFEDVDENGSGTDFPADLQSQEKVTQDFYGGIQNSLTFHGFQLDLFFQFVKQTGWNYLIGYSVQPGGMSNQPAFVMKRWQKPGDVSDIQKFTQTSGDAYEAYNNGNDSDNQISDASFIRLKTLSLSYQIPFMWAKRMKLQKCRVYMQGQNLLTITNYKGLDPENQSMQSLPPLRILTAGVQLTF